ncbi:MAG: hypothetical protein IJL80_01060 [Treponema sp.]|nr:hypothetical protein [Treponema sp.]
MELYPNETWVSEKAGDKSSVFVSSAREADGAKDPAVYASDKLMATALAKATGKDVFMLPERNKGGKNPDCVFDGATMEMKHVRGGQRKVGVNALGALSQSKNVFLYVDKPISIESCLSGIRGTLTNSRNQAKRIGASFTEPKREGLLYIFTKGELHKCTWGDVL